MWGQSLSDTVTSQERPLNIQAILFPRWPTRAGARAKTRGKWLKLVAPARLHPGDEGQHRMGDLLVRGDVKHEVHVQTTSLARRQRHERGVSRAELDSWVNRPFQLIVSRLSSQLEASPSFDSLI